MTIVEVDRRITGGVDTHLDVNVAAALDEIGGLLGVESFATTVAELPGLFPVLSEKLTATMAGYGVLPEHAADDFVVPAGLGGLAGPAGALVLAENALRAAR